ncbi:hypothetical protein DE146DRAFT_44754 [Phaeosphaeria sp. MPI-PUGE-AT-0046c]|nr:hypothetical protein DE146DRAFT_44754 [Phaeosphaeria sp. MPI-PUGE-AT-0046c]
MFQMQRLASMRLAVALAIGGFRSMAPALRALLACRARKGHREVLAVSVVSRSAVKDFPVLLLVAGTSQSDLLSSSSCCWHTGL